jgi:hypothetical protein
VWVVATEAAKRVGQEIDARRRGRPDVNRAGLEACEGAQLLLAGLQRGECLARPSGEQGAGLGKAAPPSVSLDQLLARRRFEQPQVLACGWLPDAHHSRGGGDGPLPLDLHEEPKASRVPEERE